MSNIQFQNSPLYCDCELVLTSIDAEELTPIVERQTVEGNGGTRFKLSPDILPNRHYSADITIVVSHNSRYTVPQQNISKIAWY